MFLLAVLKRGEHGIYQDLHLWVAGSHLVDELAEGSSDNSRRLCGPDIVGSQHHHDNVRLGSGQPWYELVLVRNVGGEITSVALIATVEWNTTVTRVVEGADKVNVSVGSTSSLEVVDESCSPATLEMLVGIL